jgi:hypothetical protein
VFPPQVLQKALLGNGQRSLLILDGLDEVSYAFDYDSPMGGNLNKLLKQENIIITSRPHSTNILGHMPPDLELETIGFFPEQVEEFLQGETEQTGTSEKAISEIRSFIQSHPVVQSLVRIPIQLDAICYAWNSRRFSKDNITMTMLYRAITRQLWEKDAVRLGKTLNGQRITSQQIQDCTSIRPFVEPEASSLKELAFIGLHNKIIEFRLEHLARVDRGQRPILNDCLVGLSFLRSSDNSLNPVNRTYHFLYLTFQEFFAAQYFVRQWLSNATITHSKVDSTGGPFSRRTEQITPEDFLKKEKYSVRYNIFWRFVAGLMQIEDNDCHVQRFFDVLEGEPRDLLGPAQQRLIIHCLSEIDQANEGFRSRARELEDNY